MQFTVQMQCDVCGYMDDPRIIDSDDKEAAMDEVLPCPMCDDSEGLGVIEAEPYPPL